MTPLPTRAVGSTGVELSEIGFGAAGLGNLLRETSEEDARASVDEAWDLGVRSFDTAPHYGLGLSERRLGAALRDRPRDEFILSTKVGRLLRPNPVPTPRDDDGFIVPGDLHRVWDFTADGVRRSLDESLDRLGLDRVDIVYAHDPEMHSAAAGVQALEALGELREAGVVRAIGVGTNSAEQVASLCATGLADVIMLAGRYTLLEQAALETALEPAADAGVAIVAVGVFNSGLLSRPAPDTRSTYDYGRVSAAVLYRAERLAAVCREHGVELPDAAIAFPLRHRAVVSIALGMRTAGQVAENLARYSRSVPDALWSDLVSSGLLDPRSTPTDRNGHR
jgi:D-threo-aldose 1-dehydrogenase